MSDVADDGQIRRGLVFANSGGIFVKRDIEYNRDQRWMLISVEQESQRAEQEARRAERLAAQLRALGVEPEA